MSRHVISRNVTSCHVMSRHVTSCPVMSRHMSYHVTSYHVENRGTVTRPTLHCQLTSSTRNQFKLSMTVFVGCPEGCRYNTASAVYDLVFFIFFYSPFVLRNYSTDSHKIFRNCVFLCRLNNPVVLKFFGRHLAEKNAKNRENLVKISRVDSDFRQ